MRVVKLGGSLSGAPELKAWLAALAGAAGRVVLVPGGGPFADAVRDAQARLGFDDRAAHRMALLAMEQFGMALCGLEPDCLPARDEAEIAASLAAGATPVWMPSRLCLGAPDIPESWDVTSDSLALWLAARLGADGLALVKSVEAAGGADPAALARAGIVDRAFPEFHARFPLPWRVFGPSDAALLDGWLSGASA